MILNILSIKSIGRFRREQRKLIYNGIYVLIILFLYDIFLYISIFIYVHIYNKLYRE